MMQTRRMALAAVAGLAALAVQGHAASASSGRRALLSGIEGGHPSAYYERAMALFGQGRRDEAVFVFYLGQLRYRAHLAARPDLPRSGDPAVFSSLSEVVGRPINEYAFGDIPTLAATLDEVLAFDAANPDRFTPRNLAPGAQQGVRDGLVAMRRQLVAQADQIRAQRERNGLPNRR